MDTGTMKSTVTSI